MVEDAVLRVRGLQSWYGPSQALHGIDIDVAEGEVVALLGRNGAGKSTLLKAIMGLMAKQKGEITFRGKPVAGLAPHRIGRLGIAYCPDDRGIYASLSVMENLRLPPIIAKGGMSEQELFDLFPNLLGRRAAGSQLSGGEQQMLAMARILRTGARMLLLDEPTEGLAPVIVQRIGMLIKELKRRGYTILLVEQNLRFATQMADRAYLIESGKTAMVLDATALVRDVDAVASRLGV